MNTEISTVSPANFPVSLKTYLTVISIMTVANIIVYTIGVEGVGYMTTQLNFLTVAITTLITFPIVSAVLALIISFIPYKDMSYRKKYLPALLVIFFILNSLVSATMLFGLARLMITKL